MHPPVAPMLARLSRDLPGDRPYVFEPKWDGFRCLAFRAGHDVDLRSRNDRPFARYFPEVVEALRALPEDRLVLDGELVVVVDGRFDFEALQSRLHPAASRVALLAARAPARFVAFDVLACGDDDLRPAPFVQRRARLAWLLADAADPLELTPATTDPTVAAAWLDAGADSGTDGVVAKDPDAAYQPGKRAMTKVKPEHTADCVVAGLRLYEDAPGVSSLLLGLYDGDALHHVGVVTAFPAAQRLALLTRLRPLATELVGHPWEHGFGLEGGPVGRLKGAAGRWTPELARNWVPLRPELVCEVAYDHLDGWRWRHPARFRRWRPDRDPRSCRLDQLHRG